MKAVGVSVCTASRRAVVTLMAVALLAASACERSTSVAKPMAPQELAERIKAGSAPIILDVRTPEEYAAGHIPGAVNVPHDQLADRLQQLPGSKSDEIVVHCQAGRRAGLAEEVLSGAGFENLRDLEGHMQAWREKGLPVE